MSDNEQAWQEVYELALSALVTDGAHHKQWFIEEILRRMTTLDGFEDLRSTLDWKRGIVP